MALIHEYLNLLIKQVSKEVRNIFHHQILASTIHGKM